MAVRKHTHRYARINGFWYCDLLDCSHMIPTNWKGGSPEGNVSVCHGCEIRFEITQQLMGLEAGKEWMDQPDYKVLCESCALAAGQVIFTDDILDELEKGNATD